MHRRGSQFGRRLALQLAAWGFVAVAGNVARGETLASWLSPVSGNWTDATLWSTSPNYPANDLPNPGDTYNAVIDATGAAYTVSLDAPAIAVNGLSLNAASATLGGSGVMLVNSNLTWNSGTFAGSGTTIIAHGAVLTLGATVDARVLGRVLENSGTTNFTGGSLGMTSGTFTNLSNGVVNISSTGNFTNVFGTNTLANLGTMNVGAGSNTTVLFSPRFINSGTLAVSAGTLFFNGTITQNDGAYITGPGFINLSGGQTLSGGVTTFAGTGIHLSGQVTGPGDLYVANNFEWMFGTIGGSGIMTIPAGVSLNSGTVGNRRELERTLNNSGTINLGSGGLVVGYGNVGTLNNLAGGVINLGAGGSLSGGFAQAQINNGGVINVNAGSLGLVTFSNSGSQSFTNSATISVNGGTAMFSTNASTFTHAAGSRLAGAGTAVLSGTGRHVIAGNVDWSVANVYLNAGTILNNGQLSVDGTLNLNGGTMSGTGTYQINGTLNWNSGTIGSFSPPAPAHVEIAPGGTFNIGTQTTSTARTFTGVINNAGVTNYTGGGSLMLQSGIFHNLPGGVFNTSIKGNPFLNGLSPNSGILNDGTMNVNAGVGGTGSLLLAVPFTNNGTINVSGGTLAFYFHPAISGGTINGPVQNILDLTLTGGHIDGLDGVSGKLTIQSGATVSAAHIGQSTIDIGAGATLQIRPDGTDQGTSRSSLPTFAAGATFDLTNNKLVVNYNGPDPIDGVRQAIASGKLRSSLADATHRLGYADNAVLNLPTFGGQQFITNTVLVGYTFAGDSNLDGIVDVTDLGALATHWQSSGNWTDGDFNYDQLVDVTDLGLLATNWQAGAGSLQEALASVGLDSHAVPEPVSMTILGIAVISASGTRFRKRAGNDHSGVM